MLHCSLTGPVIHGRKSTIVASFGPALTGFLSLAWLLVFLKCLKDSVWKANIMPRLSPNSWIQLAPPAPGCLPNERLSTPAVSGDQAPCTSQLLQQGSGARRSLSTPADVFWMKFTQLCLECGLFPWHPPHLFQEVYLFSSSSWEQVQIVTQMAVSVAHWAVN